METNKPVMFSDEEYKQLIEIAASVPGGAREEDILGFIKVCEEMRPTPAVWN
jgi:hypothetical protein